MGRDNKVTCNWSVFLSSAWKGCFSWDGERNKATKKSVVRKSVREREIERD